MFASKFLLITDFPTQYSLIFPFFLSLSSIMFSYGTFNFIFIFFYFLTSIQTDRISNVQKSVLSNLDPLRSMYVKK